MLKTPRKRHAIPGCAEKTRMWSGFATTILHAIHRTEIIRAYCCRRRLRHRRHRCVVFGARSELNWRTRQPTHWPNFARLNNMNHAPSVPSGVSRRQLTTARPFGRMHYSPTSPTSQTNPWTQLARRLILVYFCVCASLSLVEYSSQHSTFEQSRVARFSPISYNIIRTERFVLLFHTHWSPG